MIKAQLETRTPLDNVQSRLDFEPPRSSARPQARTKVIFYLFKLINGTNRVNNFKLCSFHQHVRMLTIFHIWRTGF